MVRFLMTILVAGLWGSLPTAQATAYCLPNECSINVVIDMSCNLHDSFAMSSALVDSKKSPKRKKLEARVSEEQKELIERAAAYDGVSQSDFIVNAAMAAARKTVQEQDVIRLNASASRKIAELLLNPPAPNKRLKKAFRDGARSVQFK